MTDQEQPEEWPDDRKEWVKKYDEKSNLPYEAPEEES